ncbi:MAG: adenylate/guanylate cyclase domain-containing protein, partial [Anaerolineales bacterium]|nr:adenylate/guanylate cyclase domain-containing protein [Anaerolineales bacterium]
MDTVLPDGTVTFLFTDIEGSTKLWELYPEAMETSLASHDAILRRVIEDHNGHVIKMTGDGLHAVFAQANKAVLSSMACQLALLNADWTGLPQPLGIRMGLHTGEAGIRAGDYFGPTVNRIARLMSVAAGGQILLSAATAELVRESLPPNVILIDLGQHLLRDLARPQHIYQLSGPGLPGEFPPLRSLSVLPNNLPAQLTRFIGRVRELSDAKRSLAASRLLTLTGPGGTGKTRLAIQLAADLLDDFPNGVWLVELAPLTDPALIQRSVGSALGIREQPDRPLADVLVDYLRNKSTLLILDNCEHLIDACAQLANMILSACPGVKILASSREALGITGETAYRLPPLSLPDGHPSAPETLMKFEAVELLVERIQAVQPGFRLRDENTHAVTRICKRLDGIPLALELAAARARLFSVEEIADRLEDSFRLLTGGSRTALPRQQTLRALIDWSYELLSEDEQNALNRLSVFAGGWMFDAAEDIIGPQTLELLSHLSEKSLVMVEEQIVGARTRYHLLETIRQYARDRLKESGQSSAVRDRHLSFFTGLATDAEPRLDGPEMVQILDGLEIELGNFRTALEWGLERDPKSALMLAASLESLWVRRGYITEGRRWLSECLTSFETLTPPDEESSTKNQALQAKGLAAAGTLAFGQGGLMDARVSLEESARLARQVGDRRMLARVLGLLGSTYAWLGNSADTEAVVQEGLALSREAEDPLLRASILSLQAQQASYVNKDFLAARDFAEEGMRLVQESGNPFYSAMFIMGLGQLEKSQGRYAEARTLFEDAETLFNEMGDRTMVIAMQSERAHVA